MLRKVGVHLANVGGMKHDAQAPIARLAPRKWGRSQRKEQWQDQTRMPVREEQRMLPVSSL